jgi:hypothetical protein
MSVFRKHMLVLAALLALGDGRAAPLLLNIHLTAQDRQFLIANRQKIAIVLPSPASDENASVSVALVLQPIANVTQVAFETSPVLYLAYAPIGSFDTIRMAMQAQVAYGQAYSFDGVGINGEGAGVDGYVALYYAAPDAPGPPVVAGLAGYVYDVATGKPAQPAPLNHFTLNRYETRLIPRSAPLAWVFVSTDVGVGSVLPVLALKPVAPSAPAQRGGSALPGRQTPALQLGRYLPVRLDASEQTTIHFDINGNAFGYADSSPTSP